MTTVCKQNKCNGCMACMDICPKNCLKIEDTFLSYNAVKDPVLCIHCGQCETICPNNHPAKLQQSIYWKQGWATDGEIREKSASGGVASSIIKSFIVSGGYVASCLFQDGQFVFEITNNLEKARDFAGSKYVKSNPIGIYKKIQERLKTDKVLFVGLPCQVAGVKNFIQDQKNLFTIDLICHGTPSPKILDRFLHECGYEISDLKDLRFRDRYDYSIMSNDIVKLELGRDAYMISFLYGVNYTENCYSCRFATNSRIADITLGDSWGTELKREEKNGISLTLVQTEKGRKLLNDSALELKDVEYEKALKANHQLNYPTVLSPERERYSKMLENGKTIKQATVKLFRREVYKQRLKCVLIRLGIYKRCNFRLSFIRKNEKHN